MSARAPAFVLVAVIVIAAACEGIINHPGTITVTNTSPTETAVLAILTDDSKSYPTLGPGASAQIKTQVGGRYEVRVVMTPASVREYLDDLRALKENVVKIVDGTVSDQERTFFFFRLAEINGAISAATTGGGAGCTGTITLNLEKEQSVAASIAWTTAVGGGFWDATCGSS